MAKWRVTHEDGRTTDVYASDDRTAKKQANHEEQTRIIIAGKREIPPGPDASMAIATERLKD